MRNYEMKIIPNTDENGKVYWTASYPAIEGCVGCGETADEAVKEAQENLEFYLEFLQEEGAEIPNDYVPAQYSGKIALRVAKSTHEKIANISKTEGISINSVICSALENFLGIKKYEFELDKKIQRIQELTEQNLILQGYTVQNQNALWSLLADRELIYEGADEQ
ncbi:MAG: type II toxin-antitoxin system HicB family antitoxin [Clostridia bacterium]|nr:type II toxin-antitoxin system HicB family antitoxin [Clostridia bacterium]